MAMPQRHRWRYASLSRGLDQGIGGLWGCGGLGVKDGEGEGVGLRAIAQVNPLRDRSRKRQC
jgi:hypothetical protein